MSIYDYDRTAAAGSPTDKVKKIAAKLDNAQSSANAAVNSLKRREEGGFKTWDSLSGSDKGKIESAVSELEKAANEAYQASRKLWSLLER